MNKEYNEEIRLQSLKEFVDEYANEEELTSVGGVRATIDIIEEQLNNYKKLLNSNPSEALECLEKIIDNLDDYADFEIKQEANEYIETIKQALLKAQEPKHYLKWEDLEKLKTKDDVKVKMNDTEFVLVIQIDCLNDIYIQLYKEKENGICINLLSDFFRDKDLFNNLRLEVVE